MGEQVSIDDLIAVDDEKKIEIPDITTPVNSLIQLTRREIDDFTNLPKISSARKQNFYEIVPETELEKSIDNVLNKKIINIEEERQKRAFMDDYLRKMARIKKIKSRVFRRIKRKEKIKKRDELRDLVCNKEKELQVKDKNSVPDSLLKRMDSKAESMSSTFIVSPNEKNAQNNKPQARLIKLAFENDEDSNALDFKKEKERVVNAEVPRSIETTLPGWGGWAGAGMKTRKTRINTTMTHVEGIKYSDRKDFNKSNLISNEKIAEINDKYTIELPYGYTEQEYKKKVKTLMSKECNTLRIFNKLIKPKKSFISGQVIKPRVYDPDEIN